MLFSPKRKPDLTKYLVWSNFIHLTDPSCFIYDPFNFESHSDIVFSKIYIVLCHWKFLLVPCNGLCIVLPIISSLTDTKPNKKRGESNISLIILFVCKYISSETLIMSLALVLVLALLLPPTLSSALSLVLALAFFLA